MIDATFVRQIARYNRWQNENLYGVAVCHRTSGGANEALSSARSTRL
jgi:hypothetical protein